MTRPGPDTRLYHGGAPGRKPGDLLLPPCETGYPTNDERWLALFGVDVRDHGLEEDRYRADRVYLTSRRDLATAYAAAHRFSRQYLTRADLAAGHNLSRRSGELGSLYVAVPVTELEDDPDLKGFSFQCSRARVVSVYDPCVMMSPARFERIMRSVMTFDGAAL